MGAIIKSLDYFKLDGAGSSYNTIAGDSSIWSHVWNPSGGIGTTPTKVHQSTMLQSGKIRVKFHLAAWTGAGTTTYGQIYKNGVVFGTVVSTTTTSSSGGTAFSQDIDVTKGETVELWIWTNQSGAYGFSDYMNICIGNNFAV